MLGRSRSSSRRTSCAPRSAFDEPRVSFFYLAVAYRILVEAEEKELAKRAKVTPRDSTPRFRIRAKESPRASTTPRSGKKRKA